MKCPPLAGFRSSGVRDPPLPGLRVVDLALLLERVQERAGLDPVFLAVVAVNGGRELTNRGIPGSEPSVARIFLVRLPLAPLVCFRGRPRLAAGVARGCGVATVSATGTSIAKSSRIALRSAAGRVNRASWAATACLASARRAASVRSAVRSTDLWIRLCSRRCKWSRRCAAYISWVASVYSRCRASSS